MKIITSIKSIALLLILFFASIPLYAANYYWVGGSGNWSDINHWRTTSGGNLIPTVIPGPTDDVYFDANSGFTATSKTVTVNVVTANCRNITFAGSSIAPALFSQGNQMLNIYGSSEWQTGMVIGLSKIYYRHTGQPKTIKSNGVIMGTAQSSIVYLEEETTMSLLDDFQGNSIFHLAGTFNTNNHQITLSGSFNSRVGTKPRVLNLGTSTITASDFDTNSSYVTVNSNTSHITIGKKFNAYGGQKFYNVTFTSFQGSLGTIGTNSLPISFNRVEFKDDGRIRGANSFKELILTAEKNYSFEANTNQTITGRFSVPTPLCSGWTAIVSTTAGQPAFISAPSSAVIQVSGVVMQDFRASGGANFVAQSSVNLGNTTGWSFPTSTTKNLYWIGGSGNWNDKAHWAQTSGGTGGYCVPGPLDNVFFDTSSGFTSENKTVTIANTAYCRNITFAGSSVAPTLTQMQGTSQTLNVYGSSEWQANMSIDVSYIYYKNTNTPKTIKSNGVEFGVIYYSHVYFEEKTSISLLDDFKMNKKIGGSLLVESGTFNTNNFELRASIIDFYEQATINLGSSNIYFSNNLLVRGGLFNAGTSHIYQDDMYGGTGAIQILNLNLASVSFNDVTFLNEGWIVSDGRGGTSVHFNKVNFKKKGLFLISQNNNVIFNELVFSGGYMYEISTKDGATIDIDKWELGGTPCNLTTIQNFRFDEANINITGTTTHFNLANIKNISAVGKTLYFGAQSIDSGGNKNIVFKDFGKDWLCHEIDDTDSRTYIINTDGFYGNERTTYKWYKLNDVNYNPATVIATSNKIDIRDFGGYGTYKVDVTYLDTDGVTIICEASNEINVVEKTALPTITGLTPTGGFTICRSQNNTLAEISVNGADIKWYGSATATDVLVSTTSIQNGKVYYVTQTLDDCESNRVAVHVTIKNCINSARVNPGIRMRVAN